ncbi:MAG: hypothetical protein ABIN11_02485 [candidate division WOR-3 bacterium]
MFKRFLMVLSLFFVVFVEAEYVRNISLENRTFTKEDFIKKQLTFCSSDTVDSIDIEKSKLNLLKTELFGEVVIDVFKVDSGFEEKIDPKLLRKDNTDDTVDVRVTAKEMLVFLPSLGFSTTKPYSITLGASYGNLFAQRHKIELAFTFLDVKGIYLLYFIPTVYSRKYSGEYKIFYTQNNRDILDIIEYHKGVYLATGYSFIQDLSSQLIVGFDRVSFKDDTFSLSYKSGDMKGYDEFLQSGLKLTLNKKNDPFFPTSGNYDELTFLYEKNFWGTDIDRIKFSFNNVNFFKFFKGTIAFRNKFLLQNGTLTYYNLSEPDAFENRAVPESDITDFNRYSGTFELRYPLFKIPFEYPIIGRISFNYIVTLFADWTTIANDFKELKLFQKSKYLYGYGVGFMFFTEIFDPIGIQIGFSPVDGYSDIFKKLKYNIFLLCWNF